MASETDAYSSRFLIAVACAQARSIASRVHRLRWVCSVLLLTTGVVLLVIDLSGCAKHRLPGGLAKLKWCRLARIDEQLLCGKFRVFENLRTHTGRIFFFKQKTAYEI